MQILQIILATTDLARQQAFYTRLFQAPPHSLSADAITFAVGASLLTFQQTAEQPAGPYHFAMNIPENQFVEAFAWLREHVPLISDETGSDTFFSSQWNAHMVYFYDPAGNIVEWIARHSLPSTAEVPFSGHSVLNISEIGVAAQDVAEQVAAITARANLLTYQGAGSDTFAPVGDMNGLLIVVKQGRIWYPNTGKAAVRLPLTVVTQTEDGPMIWQFS